MSAPTSGVQLRGGRFTLDPRLDRIPLFDPRSRDHQVRELLGPTRRRVVQRYWTPGPTTDQGAEGQCVAEGTIGTRNGAPFRRLPTITAYAERQAFYHQCQHADPWDGCYLGLACPVAPSAQAYGGTAVLTGMQLGKERGWWSEYRWIGAGSGRLEDDVVQTLSHIGPIVLGVPWTDGMYETNPDGLVDISGPEVGAHCLEAWELIPRLRLPRSFAGTKPAVAWHNSWGDGYGVTRRRRTGVGYILLTDLLALLERGGEGAVPLA